MVVIYASVFLAITVWIYYSPASISISHICTIQTAPSPAHSEIAGNTESTDPVIERSSSLQDEKEENPDITSSASRHECRISGFVSLGLFSIALLKSQYGLVYCFNTELHHVVIDYRMNPVVIPPPNPKKPFWVVFGVHR